MNTEDKNRTGKSAETGSPDPRDGNAHLPKDYDADDMRQGEIVLRSKRQRAIILGIVCAGALLIAAVAVATAG